MNSRLKFNEDLSFCCRDISKIMLMLLWSLIFNILCNFKLPSSTPTSTTTSTWVEISFNLVKSSTHHLQGCKNVTTFLRPKMVIRTFLSSYINILMDRLYMILINCLFNNVCLCNLGVFTPSLYSLNIFLALNTIQMGQICYLFPKIPIEVKPSLVPLVPRYLSFCSPESRASWWTWSCPWSSFTKIRNWF